MVTAAGASRYHDMPRFGLGAAFGALPATARMGGLRDPFQRPLARAQSLSDREPRGMDSRQDAAKQPDQ